MGQDALWEDRLHPVNIVRKTVAERYPNLRRNRHGDAGWRQKRRRNPRGIRFLFKEDIEACIRFAATGARLSFWQEREREEENRELSLSEVAVGLIEKRGLSSDTGSQ